jgi:hypothetical protein
MCTYIFSIEYTFKLTSIFFIDDSILYFHIHQIEDYKLISEKQKRQKWKRGGDGIKSRCRFVRFKVWWKMSKALILFLILYGAFK